LQLQLQLHLQLPRNLSYFSEQCLQVNHRKTPEWQPAKGNLLSRSCPECSVAIWRCQQGAHLLFFVRFDPAWRAAIDCSTMLRGESLRMNPASRAFQCPVAKSSSGVALRRDRSIPELLLRIVIDAMPLKKRDSGRLREQESGPRRETLAYDTTYHSVPRVSLPWHLPESAAGSPPGAPARRTSQRVTSILRFASASSSFFRPRPA
jgi:hypothetical protein